MEEKHGQNEEQTQQPDNTKEEHSMLCNEELFFAGLKAAAVDMEKTELEEENK